MPIFDDNINIYKGIKDEIRRFIESNYYNEGFIISDKPNKNGLYEVSSNGNIIVKNENINSLTNSSFEWSEIGGYFSCFGCINLKILEGAPEKVNGTFVVVIALI